MGAGKSGSMNMQQGNAWISYGQWKTTTDLAVE